MVLIALAFAALGFLVLYFGYTPSTPSGVSDATKDDRCAQYRTVDAESGVSSLGYKGRIQQIFHGCF